MSLSKKPKKYEVVDSTIRASNTSFPIEEGSPAFHFRLSLTNTGKNSIINDFDWSIYFYQVKTKKIYTIEIQ